MTLASTLILAALIRFGCVLVRMSPFASASFRDLLEDIYARAARHWLNSISGNNGLYHLAVHVGQAEITAG